MFPELDKSPEHKEILRIAKSLHKIRADRKEALTQSKQLEDKTQEELVGKLHDAGISKFRHEGIKLEIVPRSEKVKINVGTEEDEDDDDEGGEVSKPDATLDIIEADKAGHAEEGDEERRRRLLDEQEAAKEPPAEEAPKPRRRRRVETDDGRLKLTPESQAKADRAQREREAVNHPDAARPVTVA